MYVLMGRLPVSIRIRVSPELTRVQLPELELASTHRLSLLFEFSPLEGSPSINCFFLTSILFLSDCDKLCDHFKKRHGFSKRP